MCDERILKQVFISIFDDPRVRKCLERIRAYDEYTYTHSERVAVTVLKLGTEYYMNDTMLRNLGTAALLHDYGKINIPLSVLNKKSKLTDEEFNLIKSHPLMGAYQLQTMGFNSSIIRGVAEHHDGSEVEGYPFGIPFVNMSIISRLIEVADIADAMIYKRVYQNAAKTPAEVLDCLIRNNKIDNRVVEILESMLSSSQVDRK